MKGLIFSIIVLTASFCFAQTQDFVKHLQSVSFTVKTNNNEGSATLITRESKLDGKPKRINLLLTAGHVVSSLKTTRTVINSRGDSKTMVEFKDAYIVKEFRQDGRRIGETKLDVKVLKYSDADDGDDIAILMVRAYGELNLVGDTVVSGVEFVLNEEIPEVGTKLYHCGSLLGQLGANSFTDGIMSQIGRVYNAKVYDQTTVTAFPGSSGGGVWVLQNEKPKYVGMVTRGSGETFNLVVPIRRLLKWSKDNKIEWVFDPSKPVPSIEEIEKMPVVETIQSLETKDVKSKDKLEWNFLDSLHNQNTKNVHQYDPC